MSKFWIPKLSAKQFAIFNDYHLSLLVSGPRKSGKTLGVAHKVIRHSFDTDRARIGIFSKTVKVAKDGGCWSDLVETVIPEWIDADVGLKWKTPPKVDGSTRQTYCEIVNRFGTASRIVLNSLDFDDDIEEAIKGKRYSMIWFNELSNFKIRKVFDISTQQLRMVHLPFHAHQWIADTNPADDGEDSWIYKLWYEDRVLENHPDPEFQKNLGLVEVLIPENPFLPVEEVNQLKATYRHDPALYDRYINGIWTSATTDSHFADVFKPEIHVIGNTDSPKEEEWELLLPQEGCDTIVTGWDGGSVNHSVSFLEPWNDGVIKRFNLLDEVCIIDENISIAALVEMVLERMEFWEHEVGKPLMWRHWSDMSAFNSWRTAAAAYDHTVVYNESGGRIILQAAAKYAGAVNARINIIRRLLFEDRLLLSARCVKHIGMLRGLRKGRTAADFVSRKSVWKHMMDSCGYCLESELPVEMIQEPRAGTVKPKLVMMS